MHYQPSPHLPFEVSLHLKYKGVFADLHSMKSKFLSNSVAVRIIPDRLKPFVRNLRAVARNIVRWPIPIFGRLEIETNSSCNRTCPNCIRNSHPDRTRVKDWFSPNLMPTEMVEQILKDAQSMGFNGSVCLQHYNEPLMDERIEQLGQYARDLNSFEEVFIDTNVDFLTAARAARLDGVFHRLVIALYMGEPKKSERERWVRTLFYKTRLDFTSGHYFPTHFSPSFDVEGLAKLAENHPCSLPAERMILNHRGDMLLCCEDLIGNFDLGSIKTHSISELWYGEKHQRIVKDLSVAGGRKKYSYCITCPRS